MAHQVPAFPDNSNKKYPAPTRVFGSLIDVLWLWLTMWTATAGVVRARKRFAVS